MEYVDRLAEWSRRVEREQAKADLAAIKLFCSAAPQAITINRLAQGEIAGTHTDIINGEIVVREVTHEEMYLPNPKEGSSWE